MCESNEMYPEWSSYYENVDKAATIFDELPSEVQEDLTGWFNTQDPDDEDKQRLLELYQAGLFQAWTCPHCGTERVYRGDPDSYDNFQGVCNQDFSFFGNRDKYTENYISAMCDYCRCHG